MSSQIVDRLYTEEGGQLAMSWLFENITTLQSNLATAVPVAFYAASYAAKRFLPEGIQLTAADADFLGQANSVLQEQGFAVDEAVQGNGLLAQMLLAMAKQLLEKWLSS